VQRGVSPLEGELDNFETMVNYCFANKMTVGIVDNPDGNGETVICVLQRG